MANPTELAVAYISILPSIVGLESKMQAALSPLQGQADKAGAKAGEGFSTSFGSSMKNSTVAVDKLTASTRPLAAAMAGVGDKAKAMGAAVGSAGQAGAAGIDKLAASSKPLMASLAGVSDKAKLVGAAIADGATVGTSALDRLQAAATIAGAKAAASMDAYRAAAASAAEGTAPAIASLDRFGAEAVLAAAKAEDALKVYAAAAATAGAEAGAGLAHGVEAGTAEATASMERSTELVRGLAGGLLAGFAIGGAIEFFKDAAKAAQDDATGARLVKLQFGEASEEVLKFSENAANSFGLSAGAANAAAAKMGEFLGSFKIGGKEAADMSTTLVGLSADIGKFTNSDPASVEAAIQTALKGRATALKQFGINVSAASVQQEAFTHGIAVQGAALTDTQKAMATYYAILDQSKDKQGAFAASAGLLQTSQQQLTANLENMAGDIGKAALPALSALGDILVNLVVPGIKALFAVIQPAITGFEELPKPIQDIMAGLGLLLLLGGPLKSMFSAIVVGIQNFVMWTAEAKAASLAAGVEVTTMGAAMDVAGASILAIGAAMAPFLIVAGAAAAVMLIFSHNNDDSAAAAAANKAAIDSLADTLDTLTGKLTLASAVKIGQGWVQAGIADEFDNVAGGAAAAAAAIVKGGSAVDKVRQQLLDGADAGKMFTIGMSDVGQNLDALGSGSAKSVGGINAVMKASESGGSAIDVMAKKIAAAGGSYSDSKAVMEAFANQVDAATPGLEEFNKQNDAGVTASQIATDSLAIQAKTTADLTAQQKVAVAQATKSMQSVNAAASTSLGKAADDAKSGFLSAQSDWDNFVTHVAGLHITVDADGVQTFATDAERAFAKFNTDSQVASANAALFWASMVDPNKATDQQQIYADAAAIRAVGAALRDQQGKRADVDSASAALAAAKAGHLGTQEDVDSAQGNNDQAIVDLTSKQQALTKAEKDGKTSAADLAVARDDVTAAQNKVTSSAKDLAAAQANLGKQVQGGAAYAASVAAAQRDLANAQSDAADTAGANYDAQQKVGQQAAQRIAQIAQEDMATKGHAVTVAAVTKYLSDQRKAFIKSETDSGVALSAAKAAADAIGLIPGDAAKIIDKNHEYAIKGAAALKAAADDAARTQTLKFNVDTKDAIGDIGLYGQTINLFPKNVKSTFTADVVTAALAGQRLYRVYDATTGTWKAQFETPGAATAQIKAGSLVQQYDKARGTWTANLAATDNASGAIAGVQTALNGVHDKTVDLKVLVSGAAGAVSSAIGSVTNLLFKAEGGIIHGPGTGTSDDIPAWLSNGEFVVRARQVPKHRGLLEAINNGGLPSDAGIPKFATGGIVGKLGGLNVDITSAGNIEPALEGVAALFANVDKRVAAANAAAAASAASGSAVGAGAARAAESQLGVPYVYAAESPGVAFDCSGLTKWAYEQVGIALEHYSGAQAVGQKVLQNQLQPGDLSVWQGHVNMYIGNGQIIEAPQPGENVHERPVYTENQGDPFLGFWRPAVLSKNYRAAGGPTGVDTGTAAASADIGGSGVERWRSLALQVAQAKGEANRSVDVMLNQMSRESSGNPLAQNNTDSNAQAGHPSKGLLQFIDSTFEANEDPGFTNIWDPASQMHAWYNYIDRDYGGWEAYSHRSGDTYGAYADGGIVRGPGTGRSDSIPARVSNGEYIVNAASTAANLPLLHAINGFADGGLVGTARLLAGHSAAQAGPELANVVQALQDIAQAVADARQAVTDKSNLAVTARDNAAQMEAALKDAIRAKASRDTIAQARVRAATADSDYRSALRTYESYRDAATAADAFQRSQQRAFQAQQGYAAQMDRLTVAMGDAQTKLSGLLSSRSGLMDGISSTVSGFDGGITGHADTRSSFATILKGQQYDATQAQAFNSNIVKLSKLGLSNASLNTIATAGVDGGGVTAAALAKANPAQIKQLNAVTAQMHHIGDNVGNVVAGQFYDAGIASVDGYIHGLQSRDNVLEKALSGLANKAVATLRKDLQIHSPSQVMHDLGVQVPAGFSNGIAAGHDRVRSAVASMVSIPGSVRAPAMAAGSPQSRPIVNVNVDRSDPLAVAVASMITTEIDGFAVDLGHSLEKAGMQG